MINPSRWTDREIDQVIGDLLRAGVIISAIVVLIGGAIYLIHHGHEIPEHHVFRSEPREWRTLSGVFSASNLKHGQGIIMAGLLILIATPIARVALSLGAFALEHDWMYTGFTATVLGLLLYSLFLS
jgi:uncharacterized membrane protein